MELRHLEYFVTVAEEGSFTRAAARLHVVQSAVSAGIKALERELRTEILRRNARGVSLTEAGAALMPRARETLDSMRAAVDAVDGVRGGVRGELRLGLIAAVPWIDLPDVLGRLHAEHPGVRLRLTTRPGGSQELAAAVAAGQLDTAILSEPGAHARELHLMDLASFQMRLLVPASHPLAGRRKVRLSDLTGEDFIDQPIGFGTRAIVDRALAAEGLVRHVAIEVSDGNVIADYVRHGLGIAIVPDAFIRPDRALRALDIADDDLTWSMRAVLPKGRRPTAVARVLVDLLAEAVADRPALGASRLLG